MSLIYLGRMFENESSDSIKRVYIALHKFPGFWFENYASDDASNIFI